MARTRIIFRWLSLATKRGRQSFTFAGNNLSYAALVLLFMLDPAASAMLLMLMGIIIILPMSSDPLRVIPKVRMRLWPLTNNERRALRLITPWLSPMTWIVVALALWRRTSVGIVGLAAGVLAAGFFAPSMAGGGVAPWRFVPRFPGPLSQLTRKNLREMMSTLDFCCGALIAVAALGWRIAGTLPPAAFLPMTLIAMMSISTIGLSLFGLDGVAGATRYRLMPLRGWQMLLAKDLAYLTIALAIALPLSVPGGLAAALIGLAVGHRAAVRAPRSQTRWRFQTGPSLGDALAQMIPMAMAAAAVVYTSPWILLPCVAALGVSVWWFGREIESARR